MVSSILTIQQKIHVINLLANGTNRKQIQEMFGIKSYHIKDIVKQKERILNYGDSGHDLNKYAIRYEYFPTVNKQVGEWLSEMISKGVSIDSKAIKVKALKVAREEGFDTFKASSGWITKIRKKYLNCGQISTRDGKGKKFAPRFNKCSLDKCSTYSSVDEEVGSWLRNLMSQEVPFNYKMIKEKAIQVANKNGIDHFKASNCWIAKMKRRQLFMMNEANSMSDKSKKFSFDFHQCYSMPSIDCRDESYLLEQSDQSTNHEVIRSKLTPKCQLPPRVDDDAGDDGDDGQSGKIDVDTGNLSAIDSTGRGRKIGYFPTIDAQVGQWLDEMAEKGSSMDYKSIREKALKVAQQEGIFNFKASDCWISKMKKHHSISSQRQSQCPLVNLLSCQGVNGTLKENSNVNFVLEETL